MEFRESDDQGNARPLGENTMNLPVTALADREFMPIGSPQNPTLDQAPHFLSWSETVRKRLREIAELQPGWDGYRSAEVNRDIRDFALSLLEGIMVFDTPAPSVAPMSNGSLMLEWDANDIELEIEISRPGSVWVSLEDRRQEIAPFEGPLSFDFAVLRPAIKALTKRSRPHGRP